MQNIFFLLILVLTSCQSAEEKESAEKKPQEITATSLVVLGNVQDAGSPQIACKKDCCRALFDKPDATRKVVSLGLIIPEDKTTYLFEATPDMPTQMKMLNKLAPFEHAETPDGIFLSHAHIGHYTGLMYLGKEAMNAQEVPVFVMPGMQYFLSNNGPWSQLVTLKNITLTPYEQLNCEIGSDHQLDDLEGVEDTTKKVFPFKVPHRDEFSETVGFKIVGKRKTALFIPDIDKWEKWEKTINSIIQQVDYALLDGTFYDGNELPGRDIKEIPHPFVIESMELFQNLSDEDKKKIYFIHFNHTNPLLNKKSPEYKEVIKRGFNIAHYGDVFTL